MRSNLIGNYSINLVNLAIPVITAPFLTRALSLESFGVYSLLQVIGIYLSAVMDFGLTSYGTREVARTGNTPELYVFWQTSWTARICLGLVAFPLTLIASFLLAKHLSVLVAVSFFVMVCGFVVNSLWLLNGLQKTASYSIPFLFIRLVSAVTMVLVAYTFKNIDLIFFIYSLGILAANLGTYFVARRHVKVTPVRVDRRRLTQFLTLSWPFAYSGFFGLFLNSSTVLFSGLVVGTQVAGGISVSDRIVKGLLALASPFTTSLFPRVSASFAENHVSGTRQIIRFGVPFILAYGLICLAVYFFRHPVLGIFGSQYMYFAPILGLLLLWSWVSVFNNFIAMQYMLASGREAMYARLFTVSAVVSVLGYFLLPRVLGEMGIPVAALMGEGLVTLGAVLLILTDVQTRRFLV